MAAELGSCRGLSSAPAASRAGEGATALTCRAKCQEGEVELLRACFGAQTSRVLSCRDRNCSSAFPNLLPSVSSQIPGAAAALAGIKGPRALQHIGDTVAGTD